MFIQMEYCTGKNDAIALYIAVKKWSSNILMQNNSQRQSMSGTAQVYDIAYDIYMLTCSGRYLEGCFSSYEQEFALDSDILIAYCYILMIYCMVWV